MCFKVVVVSNALASLGFTWLDLRLLRLLRRPNLPLHPCHTFLLAPCWRESMIIMEGMPLHIDNLVLHRLDIGFHFETWTRSY